MNLQERLLEEVVLVPGVGAREARRLCVMSLVAELAGEAHGDRPLCASHLVRSFAVVLNDALPDDRRQLLKPFALVIVGTQDSADPERAGLLFEAVLREVAPAGLRALLGNGTACESAVAQMLLHSWPTLSCASAEELRAVLAGREVAASSFLSALNTAVCRFIEEDHEGFGKAVARLLVLAAQVQSSERMRHRLWLLGIELLDRISTLRSDWPEADFPMRRALQPQAIPSPREWSGRLESGPA